MRLTQAFKILMLLMLAVALAGCGMSNAPSIFSTSAQGAGEEAPGFSRVPWDYRLTEGTVGDLIGSDMTILPDNTLMPNDDNYATGDRVWVLQFMDAELITDEQERNEVRLSAWRTIKTYRDETAGQQDLAELKVELTTEVDLVGVYKTEFNGDIRNFAIVELPSGNRIKQPIDDARYTAFSNQQTVSVMLEEVHDFADYDLAFAKFRGWAD